MPEPTSYGEGVRGKHPPKKFSFRSTDRDHCVADDVSKRSLTFSERAKRDEERATGGPAGRVLTFSERA
ncbi:hypothetical protein GCM10028815_26500 [Mariniluteicoccus flavus]